MMMTQDNEHLRLADEFSDCRSRWERERRERLQAHKEVLRGLLGQEGSVVTIEVNYDGCGDDGQIDSVAFLDEAGKAVQPAGADLEEAVVEFIYSLLEE